MPIKSLPDGLEPNDLNALVWRFMDFEKFQDLITSAELNFSRADLFDDKSEGIPPDEYLRFLSLGVTHSQREIDDRLGFIAENREAFFINCWHLFSEETATMWKQYAKQSGCGVAVSCRYSVLKSALNACEGDFYLGLVRYGSTHLTGWNVLRFITTKREEFKHEQELRALLWIPEYAGNNRHFDENNVPHPRPLTPPPPRVPKFQRRKVNLEAIISEIVVSPFASDACLAEIEAVTRGVGYTIPVGPSELTRFRHLLP